MTTHTITQARPTASEVKLFWKLYHASQRVDERWGGFTVSDLNEILQRVAPDGWDEGLDRAHRMFFLRAWQVLVTSGGFGRIVGALDTYEFNMQDPDADVIAWKPELQQQFNDAELLPVVLEAYSEARRAVEELSAGRAYEIES